PMPPPCWPMPWPIWRGGGRDGSGAASPSASIPPFVPRAWISSSPCAPSEIQWEERKGHSAGGKTMAKEVFPGVTVDQQVVHGRPVVAGTRVPVEVVVGELAGGSRLEDVMADYHLTREQIQAALGYEAQTKCA